MISRAAEMESKSMNRGLTAARDAKQDEFYTQYVDIQKEVEAYLDFDPDTFRDKVIYCNCDDPFESNFFRYFAANFNKLGLKRLVTTSYDGSPIAGQGELFPEYNEGNGKRKKPKALAVILGHVKDEDGDGAVNIEDVKLFLKRNKAARIALKGDPSFPNSIWERACPGNCVALNVSHESQRPAQQSWENTCVPKHSLGTRENTVWERGMRSGRDVSPLELRWVFVRGNLVELGR